MARKKNVVPSYLLHKSSGQARVRINGHDHLLGPYDSDESRERYGEIITKIAAGLPIEPQQKTGSAIAGQYSGPSINELCAKFLNDGLKRFSESEQHCQRAALRILRQLFGFTSVLDFGPLRLRVVRDAMVQGHPDQKNAKGEPMPRKPWNRQTVNRQVKRIQALFRWGVSLEMVPVSIATALETVRALTAAETTAAESKPRRSVATEEYLKARAELKPVYQDVLDLLYLTGARPGELLRLTDSESGERTGLKNGAINKSVNPWRADLAKHKTAHKGKSRTLFFNPEAQAILRKYMTDDPDARIFPCRRDNFGTAVKRACKRAGITPFVPHEIRHTTATESTDKVGVEATQQLLGHSTAAMTLHYAKAAEQKAIKAVKKRALPKAAAEVTPVKRTTSRKTNRKNLK